MLALLGKATKTGKAVNIGRKLLAKGGEKEQKKKDDRRRYSEPSSSLVPRGSAAPKNTSVLAPVPKLAEVNEDTAKGDDDILVIKDTVISIHKILKTTFKNESILLKQRRKDEENRKRAEEEEELEAKKEDDKKEKSGGGKMNIPMSIMDRIKAFIAGFVAYRLVPFIPQLLELVKFIPPVVDFFANTGIFLIDAFSSFLVIAKKPIDWAKGAIKNIGGEEALEKFEGLLSAFTTFANIAIIAGMASIGGGDKGGGLFGRKGKEGTGPGPGKGLTGISGKGVGQTRTTSPAAARRFASRFGRDAAEKRFGKDAVKSLGGKYGRSRVTNFARGAATGVAKKLGGRQGVKMLASLGKIGKFLKVPVIGSIISVVLSLMNGDPIQKALFKGVGTAVGGALGGLLSTLIGVPPLGLFLGGIIGDYVGDLFYTLFFGGGLKAAGAKLGNDLKGMFMGIGQGAKAIFDWVFGGGLLSLLKNVGGGIAKFALYLLNPGGLLWDILKAGGNALKAITGFVFGGGLFDLIKNITGGVFKFITYILNPGGLLFDALKQGGKIAKAIFDFAINAIGSTAQFIKDFIGGVFSRFTGNFPTIGIPEGWGIQTTLGKILGWIPFLKPYMEGGRLTAFPDLSMFVPGLGLPFFIAHLGKSMFPGSFFEGMPSGVGDVWKGAKNAVENIAEGVTNTVTNVAKGTQRAAGGIADALTFNLFDFDKKNEEEKEVEKKEEGGPVGDTETSVEKNLERTTFKPSRYKPDKVKIGKDIGGPEKLKKAGFNKKTVGYLMLASNEMKRIPFIGAIMGSAIDLLLGQRPEKSMLQAFSTNIVALSDFSTVDEVNQGSLTGLLSASALQTGGEVFGSTYGPGSIAGERDSATGALLATDPDQYQIVLSRYLETAVDNKVPNVFSAMNLAETMKEDGSGPFDSLLGPFKNFFGGIFGGGDKDGDDKTNRLDSTLRSVMAAGPDLSGDVVIMGDSIAYGVRDAQGKPRDHKMAREGASTKEILDNIKREADAGNLQGKTLQLSSGISNTMGDTDTVREQLRAAKAGGVTGVQLIGTADEGDYDQNALLQGIAQEDEFKDFVYFQGGFKASKDKVHPGSYSKLAKALSTSREQNIETRKQAAASGGIIGTGVGKGVSIAKKLMVDMNISPAAAAGIVGNLMLESGLQPDNVENGKGFEDGPINNVPVGTKRVGYGWGQWTNDRLESFRKFLESRDAADRPATDDDNYAYLIKELTSTEPIQNHWKTGTSIPEDDPSKAATWFMMNWERPSVPHQDKRQEYAVQVFESVKGMSKDQAQADVAEAIEKTGGAFAPTPGGDMAAEVERGDASKAASKLLEDFPQIKSRANSQQIYASGLGFWLKKNFNPPARDANRKGKGDLGDPPGGDMEHPDHGGVVASHKGQGHYKGQALDLGAETRGIYAGDQKYMWPYITRFLKQYGLDQEPTVPQTLHGVSESFSPVGPGGGGDGGHNDHFHVEFQGGGSIGSRKSDTGSISDYAPYEDGDSGPQIIVKTIIVEKKMPGESAIMPLPLGGGGSSDGVNINAYSNLSAGAG